MKLSERLNSLIYLWFPVFPFLAYWIVAYLAFNFGPFLTPDMPASSHLYVIAYVALFAGSYRLGLGKIPRTIKLARPTEHVAALKLLYLATWLTLIGTLLFLFDRFNSGAASLDAVQNEFANIRGDYADRTTILTTLAVIPQSFRLVAFAAYFYCLQLKLPIRRTVHMLIISIIALELINMVVSANRGSLFWIISYLFFYVVFCARIDILREILSLKHLSLKFLVVGVIILAYSYFLWVAQHREIADTAEYLGRRAEAFLKDPAEFKGDDYAALGARYQFFYYISHGFEYTNAILKYAPVINLDLLSPLGMRIEAQIGRWIPGYVYPAKEDLLLWIRTEGLSPFGWPSIFGATLAYFGVIGSLVFSSALGLVSGRAINNWNESPGLGQLIVVFLIFSSLNMSFDWIIRDFDQFVALVLAIALIRRQRKLVNSQLASTAPG